VLASALVVGITSAGVLAAWVDGEFGGAELTTGTFALVSRTDTGPFAVHGSTGAASLDWALAPLFPGQSAAAWVQVQSSGTVGGSVTLSGIALGGTVPDGSAEAALRDALRVRISATTSADPAPPECTADTPGVEVTGLTQLPAVPAQQVGPAGETTVTFCVVVTLPADAPTTAQGASLTPTWVFTGSTG
jgi:hypothetical protein